MRAGPMDGADAGSCFAYREGTCCDPACRACVSRRSSPGELQIYPEFAIHFLLPNISPPGANDFASPFTNAFLPALSGPAGPVPPF